MALDTLDIAVAVAIVAALVAYFTKGTLWAVDDDGLGSSGSGSRDIVVTLNETGKKAIVFFGSQTGTAEDYAHKFAKEFQARLGIPTLCADLSDYDFESLGRIVSDVPGFKMITFFNATYGEGEPTDDAVDFINYLEDGEEDLEGLKFANFGLGNSTYEFYNAMGKKVDKGLQEKGAERLGQLGLGDDGMGSMDEDYLAWKDSLFDVLKDALKVEEKEAVYEPGIKVVENTAESFEKPEVALGEPDVKYINPKTVEQKQSLQYGPFDATHPYLAPIATSKELCSSSSGRHCVHAEFDISNSGLKYSTGDHLAIWPSNSDAKTAALLKVIGLSDKVDTVINVTALDKTVKPPVPSPTTYGAVIRYYLEISGPVSRQFIAAVVQFAPDEAAKAKAKLLSEDKDLFKAEITDKYYDIADALSAISGGAVWDLPFEFVIESIGRIQPRYYSISSSSLSEKETIHVTAMLEAEQHAGKTVTGVTTNLLYDEMLTQNGSTLKPFESYKLKGPRGLYSNFKLPVHVRRSTFKLPSNPNTPVIMVGPGTGVAPFRGFVREKVRQEEIGESGTGKVVLFYGCRKSDEDFLYQEEWSDYAKRLGERFEMITAFSRESAKKVYVQDKMLEHSKQIADLINNGAFFYVCGDASRMARDVNKALVSILSKEKKVSEEDATEMVKMLKVQNRYQEDVW